VKRLFAAAAIVVAAGCQTTTTTTTAPPSGEPRTDTGVVSGQSGDPSNRARIHTELASLYYERGNLGVALESLRAATAADPNYAPAHGMFGLVYMELKEQNLAEQSFQRGLSMAPQDPNLDQFLTFVRKDEGRPAQVRDVARWQREGDHSASLRYWSGLLRGRSGSALRPPARGLPVHAGQMAEVPGNEIVDLVDRGEGNVKRVGHELAVKYSARDVALGEYRGLVCKLKPFERFNDLHVRRPVRFVDTLELAFNQQ